jgi:hypothetical protein
MSDEGSRIPPPGPVLDEELLQLDKTGKLARQDAYTRELEARIALLELQGVVRGALPIDPRSREDH